MIVEIRGMWKPKVPILLFLEMVDYFQDIPIVEIPRNICVLDEETAAFLNLLAPDNERLDRRYA